MSESDLTTIFFKMIAAQKRGIPKGIYSVCSANPFVLQESLRVSKENQTALLIETTCNQVNQDGGYTGMTPSAFVSFLHALAEQQGFSQDQILLGGDHLGPNPWKDQPAEYAMEKASTLVQDYIQTGYKKIHLDTSMACADDPAGKNLDLVVEAERAARLCSISEKTWEIEAHHHPPVYVIGTEVPPPGGVEEEKENLQITHPESVQESLRVYKEVFKQYGLENAWNRVIALVVQPGVEFGEYHIHEYKSEKAKHLSQFIESKPGLVYEAHSTDYQQPSALKQMVADHFAILKVGPALTFAFREAVFSLAHIERILLAGDKTFSLSNIINTVDQAMVENPKYWEAYYHGSPGKRVIARKYSFSDRIRYYWQEPKVDKALALLINNLSEIKMPLSLISQFMPEQYQQIREGKLNPDPKKLIEDHINRVLKVYHQACTP